MTAGARVENHQDVFPEHAIHTACVSGNLGPAPPVTQRTDWVASEQRLVLTGGMDYDTAQEDSSRGRKRQHSNSPHPSYRSTCKATIEVDRGGFVDPRTFFSLWIPEQLYQRSSTLPCQKCNSVRVCQNRREHVLDQPGCFISAASTRE